MSRASSRSSIAAAIALVAVALVVGCTGPIPSATDSPRPMTLADLSVAGAWSAETVDPVDPSEFRAAVGRTGLTIGDRVAWTRTEAGHWLPAEPVERSDRGGIAGWRGQLVAWSFGPVITTSQDGLVWTAVAPGPPEGNPTTLVTLGDRLLLFGEATTTNDGAWASLDAARWTAIGDAPLGINATADAIGGGLIAVGSLREAVVATTRDGLEWDTATAPADEAGGITLAGVATQGSSIVVIGDVAQSLGAWLTRDGRAWVRTLSVRDESVFLSTVTAVRGSFLISGRRNNHAMVWFSADGASWSAVQLPSGDGLPDEAAIARVVGDQVIAFGYTTKNEGNGGWSRTGYRVWSLGLTP